MEGDGKGLEGVEGLTEMTKLLLNVGLSYASSLGGDEIPADDQDANYMLSETTPHYSYAYCPVY